MKLRAAAWGCLLGGVFILAVTVAGLLYLRPVPNDERPAPEVTWLSE